MGDTGLEWAKRAARTAASLQWIVNRLTADVEIVMSVLNNKRLGWYFGEVTYLIRPAAMKWDEKRRALGHTTLLPSAECYKHRAHLQPHLPKPGRCPFFRVFSGQGVKGSIIAKSLLQCLSCPVSVRKSSSASWQDRWHPCPLCVPGLWRLPEHLHASSRRGEPSVRLWSCSFPTDGLQTIW